jgi:hypothetical protein
MTMDRTLYRDPAVRVTSEVIEVDGRRYALAELARVWHRRGERSWRALAGRGALGLAMLVPLGLGLVGVAVALSVGASPTVTVAMVLGAVLVGFLAGPLADVLLEYLDRSYSRGSRQIEIWALWRGSPVLLLRTGDQLRFGKIYRALQRALEAPAPSR